MPLPPRLLWLALLLAVPARAQQDPSDEVSLADALTASADTLTGGQFVLSYTFERADAAPFEVRLQSFAFDPVLFLESPGGALSASGHTGAVGHEDAQVVEVGTAGTWTAYVTSHERADTGRFQLTVRPLTPEALAVLREAEALLLRAARFDAQGAELYDAGRLADAESVAREALAIREAVLGPTHPDVAQSLSTLAVVLQEQGDLSGAQPLYERALAVREAGLGPDHLYVATSLNNLAVLLQALGDAEAAQPLLERALAIREVALGPDHPYVAVSLNNLALLLKGRGDYVGARPLYERALAIRMAALGPGHLEVAEGLNNLAVLLQALGDAEAAQPLLERALAIREALLGPDHLAVAESLNNLAALVRDRGDLAAARPLLERALAIREATLGPDHPDVAQSLNNLGVLLRDLGDPFHAVPLFVQALAVREATLGPDHPVMAESLTNLADLLQTLGDDAGAQPLYERALDLYEARLGPDHPAVASSLMKLAVLLQARGDDGAARSRIERAARITGAFADDILPTLSAAEQRAFTDRDLGIGTGLLLSSHRQGGSLATAYALLGGWKGLLLRELRRQTGFSALALDARHADDVAALHGLRSQVARAFRTGDPALPALTEQKEALERRLAAALPASVVADPWQSDGLDGLRSRLPADAAFADLYRHAHWQAGRVAGARYSAVVTARGAAPVLVDLGPADALDEALAVWRDAVTAERPAETAALAAALWGPLAAALPDGTARVWVSPDGDLGRAPWSVLARAVEGEARLVAQVPSARALLGLLAEPADPSARPSLLLVGGVDFGDGNRPFAPLPGTESEAEALGALAEAEGLSVTRLTAEAPTAATVARALPGATYAHLATHGFFYGESAAAYAARSTRTPDVEPPGEARSRAVVSRNPLAESGLALAGANDPEAPDGGTLTAEELVGVDLSGARLVALSACDTGRGAEVTGQGVLGLQASVTAAGARAVLMSLWSVPDASTAALMEAFYQGLWDLDLPPVEALRAAQEVIRTTPGWDAPVHWAGWVLSGDAL